MAHSHYLRETIAPDGTWRLLFAGELDLHASPQLDAWIDRAVEAGAAAVAVDLTDTTFIDSSAIGSLLRAHGKLGEAGISFEIFCDEPNVVRIFELTGLEEVLPLSHFGQGLTPGPVT
jgi:anti-anti-sigma factor